MTKLTDLEIVAGQWKARGFSFGIFTDPPGQVWKDYVKHTVRNTGKTGTVWFYGYQHG